MFFAFLLLLLITAGGFAVTYLYDEDAPFFARMCSGIIIGQVGFSLVGFLFGCLIGMSINIVALSVFVTALPLVFFIQEKFKQRAQKDFNEFLQTAKNFVSRPGVGQVVWAAIYSALIIFLWFFFDRAMFYIKGGIGIGSLHNTGDISFHLQAIYGFLDGQNYPPQNPSFAGSKFTYPFMTDLVTAMLATIGAEIRNAMFWQNMCLIVALIGIMRHFTFKLTRDDFAANIAPLLLLLSGGLGFILFFKDGISSGQGIFSYLFHMNENYTIRPGTNLRWGNSLSVMFMPQRSILMGMPLALIILSKVWEIFSNSKFQIQNSKSEKLPEISRTNSSFNFSFLILNSDIAVIGLLAGTLPLVHAHSFAVVMGMTSILALMSLKRWREWFVFFAAATIISVPELLSVTLGTATKAQNFVDWQVGWDNDGKTSFLFFWFLNAGFFIPLLIVAIALLIIQSAGFKLPHQNEENTNDRLSIIDYRNLLLFWLPFALCFIAPNVLKLAPWIWDNIKVLIYWYLMSVPLVALILAEIWRRGAAFGKVGVVSLLIVLTLSGWLDVWRVASKQVEYTIFEPDAVTMAQKARQILPPDAIVASAASHASPAALLGRRWFLGFTGHVWSHGIDPSSRERILKQIYSGSNDAERLLRENNIQYLVLSHQEREFTTINQDFLARFPVVAQSGDFRLLKVQ